MYVTLVSVGGTLEVRAISRAIDVLRYIGDSKSGASLTEIAISVGLSKATTHRVLQTLQSREFVSCDKVSGCHFLGPEFFRLAHRTDPYESLKRIARPFLESLRAETGETVTLVVRENDVRLTIDVLLSPQELNAAPPMGSKKPIHAGAGGKALLINADEAQLDELARRTGLPRLAAMTLSTATGLKREMARIRRRGYATSIEEAVEGEGAVAVPIVVHGQVVAAVNVCGPASRLSRETSLHIAKAAKSAAKRIAVLLTTKGSGKGVRKTS